MSNISVAIVGASGAIGQAFVQYYSKDASNHVYAFSRQGRAHPLPNVESYVLDITDEVSVANAASMMKTKKPLDLCLVATGFLHHDDIMPEKALKNLNVDNLQLNFLVNSVGPIFVAKHFISCFKKNERAVFAALSARVGSISDNRLGGWYSYRASKAALNMLIKTTSIEWSRQYKQAIIVGLHPGTVSSDLSKPFQSRVPKNKLFTPDYSVQQLISVLGGLSVEDTGKIFAWDGQEIPS